jgi:hypothetical protein
LGPEDDPEDPNHQEPTPVHDPGWYEDTQPSPWEEVTEPMEVPLIDVTDTQAPDTAATLDRPPNDVTEDVKGDEIAQEEARKIEQARAEEEAWRRFDQPMQRECGDICPRTSAPVLTPLPTAPLPVPTAEPLPVPTGGLVPLFGF